MARRASTFPAAIIWRWRRHCRACLQDDALRCKLGEQATYWAQNYSWVKIGDRILDVYRRAWQPQAAPASGVLSPCAV